MTEQFIGGLVVAGAIVAVGARCVVRRLLERRRLRDLEVVDREIKRRGAKPRIGMEAPDWQRIEAAGRQRWQETYEAQHRSRRRNSKIARPCVREVA